MYPLLLTAPVKDYLWGGTRLKEEFGFETDADKCAEAWVLSCHKDGECLVKNGKYAGMPLSEVLSTWGSKGVGEKAAKFSSFPLLIKLIDAKDRLSVQVHPNDEYAFVHEGESGKTEMWYIVDCDEGAELIYGFKRRVSRDEFELRIKTNTLTDVCNFVPVKKGDVFFIEAGTLHAIGKGILIAEVQQTSNATYRIYDYGRLGADGKPRPLHIEKALAVTDTSPTARTYGAIGESQKYSFGTIRELASCDLFRTELLSLDGHAGIVTDQDSFEALLILSGSAQIAYGGGNMSVKKGDCVLVPANYRVTVSGTAEILCAKI